MATSQKTMERYQKALARIAQGEKTEQVMKDLKMSASTFYKLKRGATKGEPKVKMYPASANAPAIRATPRPVVADETVLVMLKVPKSQLSRVMEFLA